MITTEYELVKGMHIILCTALTICDVRRLDSVRKIVKHTPSRACVLIQYTEIHFFCSADTFITVSVKCLFLSFCTYKVNQNWNKGA